MQDLKIKVTAETLTLLNNEASKQGITVDTLCAAAFKMLENRITFLSAVGEYKSTDY